MIEQDFNTKGEWGTKLYEFTVPEMTHKFMKYIGLGYDFNIWESARSLDGSEPRYSYGTLYKSELIHSSDLFKTTDEAWTEALEIAEDHNKDD